MGGDGREEHCADLYTWEKGMEMMSESKFLKNKGEHR